MATTRTFDGRDLKAVLEEVRKELGEDAQIISAQRVRSGGIAGFFAKEAYTVVAAPAERPAANTPWGAPLELEDLGSAREHAQRDHAHRLLALADAVSAAERASGPTDHRPSFASAMRSADDTGPIDLTEIAQRRGRRQRAASAAAAERAREQGRAPGRTPVDELLSAAGHGGSPLGELAAHPSPLLASQASSPLASSPLASSSLASSSPSPSSPPSASTSPSPSPMLLDAIERALEAEGHGRPSTASGPRQMRPAFADAPRLSRSDVEVVGGRRGRVTPPAAASIADALALHDDDDEGPFVGGESAADILAEVGLVDLATQVRQRDLHGTEPTEAEAPRPGVRLRRRHLSPPLASPPPPPRMPPEVAVPPSPSAGWHPAAAMTEAAMAEAAAEAAMAEVPTAASRMAPRSRAPMPAIGDPGEDVVDLTDRHRRSMSRAAARAEGRQRAGIAPESLAATRADLSETSWPEPEPALVRGPTEVGVIAMVGPFPRAVLRSRSMGNQVIVASPRRPPGTASSDWIRNAALAQARALRWRERGELVVVAVDSGADPDWLDEVLRALGPIRIERMDHDDQ